MKKILITLLSVIAAYTCGRAQTPARPKLVIGIVVDQMRWDYLYRYSDRYGKDGFNRLLRQGFNCQNTYINYLPSYTAPGHSSVYTGSVPAIHGIAGNDWIENTTGLWRYCTQDDQETTLGSPSAAGRMSPRNLLTSTITDELRLATNFRSRVFGIALKDRGAILPAGHNANGAYWFDDSTGNFISSSYYGKQLPAWVNRFNDRRLADTFLQQGWQTLYPAESYNNSTGDNNEYEELLFGETAPVFPHNRVGKPYKAIRSIPAGNTLTLKMARACIKAEALGNGYNTDFLCVSLSSTDYIGHAYAPNSIEVEDMYLRLDRELASFLRFLDGTVGQDNYLLFLTADHGAAHNATFLQDHHIPAGTLPEPAIAKALKEILKTTFKTDSLLRGVYNYQVVLDESRISNKKLDPAAVKNTVMSYCRSLQGIAYVVDMDHPEIVPLPIRELLINGYNRNRSGSIALIYQPGWYSDGPKGTTHGSWNPYDAHIPLLWYGWHIPAGESFHRYHMTDITATLAALLHIQVPSGCIGEVVEF